MSENPLALHTTPGHSHSRSIASGHVNTLPEPDLKAGLAEIKARMARNVSEAVARAEGPMPESAGLLAQAGRGNGGPSIG